MCWVTLSIDYMNILAIDLYKCLYTPQNRPRTYKNPGKGDPSTPLTSPNTASDSRWSAISSRARSKHTRAYACWPTRANLSLRIQTDGMSCLPPMGDVYEGVLSPPPTGWSWSVTDCSVIEHESSPASRRLSRQSFELFGGWRRQSANNEQQVVVSTASSSVNNK